MPVRQSARSVILPQCRGQGRGQEVVPVGVRAGQPARGFVLHDQLKRRGTLAPGVQVGKGRCLLRRYAIVCRDLRHEQGGP